MTFGEPTRLTAVSVVAAGEERKLAFTPEDSATEFSVTAPALAPGRNEVQWRALSLDGHVVEGSVIIVIKPPTP